MDRGRFLTISFIAGFFISLAGIMLRVSHDDSADIVLTAGTLIYIVFVVTAIMEVRSSKRISNAEKLVWTIALIFFYMISGLLYLLLGRKRAA